MATAVTVGIDMGDLEVAGQAAALLAPYADLVAIEGIGAYIRGSIAGVLGRYEAAIGRVDAARALFERALEIEASAGSTLATATQAALDSLPVRGDVDDSAALPRAAGPSVDAMTASLRRDGDVWALTFAGSTVRLRDSKGLHDLAVLVMDTRVSHELTDGSYGSRRDEAWEAARLLGVPHLSAATPAVLEEADLPEPLTRRARHVVTENARVDDFVASLRRDDWAALGPLMDASHRSLREDYEVSCAELDVAVDTARQAGAQGARMTGGSAIALVPVERVEAVQTAVTTAFVAQGWGAPDFFVAEPGPGARIVDA